MPILIRYKQTIFHFAIVISLKPSYHKFKKSDLSHSLNHIHPQINQNRSKSTLLAHQSHSTAKHLTFRLQLTLSTIHHLERWRNTAEKGNFLPPYVVSFFFFFFFEGMKKTWDTRSGTRGRVCWSHAHGRTSYRHGVACELPATGLFRSMRGQPPR